MTIADMITMYGQLLGFDLSDAGSKSNAPTDAQALVWLNRAQQTISKRIWQFDPFIPLNLSNPVANSNAMMFDLRDTSVTVTKPVIEALRVIINGFPLLRYNSTNYGTAGLPYLEQMVPNWRIAPTGTPVYAFDASNSRIVLWPPPSVDVIAYTNNFIAGQYLARNLIETKVASGTTSATQTLVSTTDIRAGDLLYFATAGVFATVQSITNATVLVLTASITTTADELVYNTCDLPDELCPALVWSAVQLTAEPNMTEAMQMQRLALYDKHVPEQIQEIAYQNKRGQYDVMTGTRGEEYIWS